MGSACAADCCLVVMSPTLLPILTPADDILAGQWRRCSIHQRGRSIHQMGDLRSIPSDGRPPVDPGVSSVPPFPMPSTEPGPLAYGRQGRDLGGNPVR